jgi:hypothetical protein
MKAALFDFAPSTHEDEKDLIDEAAFILWRQIVSHAISSAPPDPGQRTRGVCAGV